MSRRRLARLAVAWAVTLAEMEIPPEERSWQSPPLDDRELEKRFEKSLRKNAGDVGFRTLLSGQCWHAPPPAVHHCRMLWATLVASFVRRPMGVFEGAAQWIQVSSRKAAQRAMGHNHVQTRRL
jgi:hypothetical protein